MQGVRAVTLPVARRGFTFLTLTTTCTTSSLSMSTTTTLCEKKTNIFTKDSNGNIDWSKTIARIPESDFWDDVAKATGENVCVTCRKREKHRSQIHTYITFSLIFFLSFLPRQLQGVIDSGIPTQLSYGFVMG
jgi:hypothetical protein